jgi:hypothetical protein
MQHVGKFHRATLDDGMSTSTSTSTHTRSLTSTTCPSSTSRYVSICMRCHSSTPSTSSLPTSSCDHNSTGHHNNSGQELFVSFEETGLSPVFKTAYEKAVSLIC